MPNNKKNNTCIIDSIYGEERGDGVISTCFYNELHMVITQEEEDLLRGVLQPLSKMIPKKLGYIRADVILSNPIDAVGDGNLFMLDMSIQQAKDLITQNLAKLHKDKEEYKNFKKGYR